ncbi:MAG TPA: UDP-glucose 4-epimerase [Planctomycetaceae bacterium]|nr:UDP-glucose 4-epimerase [Planctomycetaceae bacterium]|tara:strand:- start:223 stop:1188 length:966 start_codon:yes stop_codon:yes gene_type:complete
MKILVTGGAGFIGSHIVDQLLAAGHAPVVVDDLSTGSRANLPEAVPFYEADVCDREALATVFKKEQPEVVCHQAAQMSVSRSVNEPSFDAQVNIMGLLSTLEQSQQSGVKRFVFASSGGVLYGEVTEPASELHPANPISPYGISKWTGEQYLRFFTREHGLETVALRYANVYGPRQNPHGEAGVVAIFCQRMLRGEGTRINGDGKYIRDYVYVEDVARANVQALTETLPSTHVAFNVGTGVPVDVNELAERLHGLTSQALRDAGRSTTVPQPEYGPPRAGDLRSNLIDATLLKQTYGWSDRTQIDSGLKTTVNWFAEQAEI